SRRPRRTTPPLALWSLDGSSVTPLRLIEHGFTLGPRPRRRNRRASDLRVRRAPTRRRNVVAERQKSVRAEAVGVHRECAGLEAFDKALDLRIVARGAQRNEQRQKMLVARMRARRLRRLLAPGDQRVDVMRD